MSGSFLSTGTKIFLVRPRLPLRTMEHNGRSVKLFTCICTVINAWSSPPFAQYYFTARHWRTTTIFPLLSNYYNYKTKGIFYWIWDSHSGDYEEFSLSATQRCGSACCLLQASSLFSSLFNPADGGDIFLRNVDWCSPDCRMLHPRRYTKSCGNALLLINRTKGPIYSQLRFDFNFIWMNRAFLCHYSWCVDMLCVKWQLMNRNFPLIPSYFVRESVT
jgi:hypothetical protein